MRFTHYMQYFVDLEGGKLIPASMFFWCPWFNFWRGVLITIYSISWWWWSANRVCGRSIFDLQIWNLCRGFLLRPFCSEPLFDKIWWYFRSWDQRLLSSLRKGKSSPKLGKAVHGPIQLGRGPVPAASLRRPPAEASNASTAAAHPPPSPEPSIIHLTPDRPLLRLPTGKHWTLINFEE